MLATNLVPRGIDAAKARNAYKGRPATIDSAKIKELHQSGMGPTQIAKAMGVARASVYRALAA